MKLDHELRYDGPYLHVDLPDVLPPDWEGIRRELDLDCGVERAFVVAPASMPSEDESEL